MRCRFLLARAVLLPYSTSVSKMYLVQLMKSSPLISTLAVALILGAVAPMNLTAAAADAEFTKLADEFLAGYFAWRPLAGTTAGLHEYDGRITDYSRGSIEGELARLRKFERQISALKPAPLGAATRFDWQVLLAGIRGELF